MNSLRILIVDDHELFRRGLRQVLESQPRWDVAGEAENGRQAVELAGALKPDVIVMDITMPEMNGLDATRAICKAMPDCHVLVLTMHESREIVHEIQAAGGRGCVLKSDTSRLLVAAVEALAHGKPFFSSHLQEHHTHNNHTRKAHKSAVKNGAGSKGPRPGPSAREREIVQLVAKGNSNKEIAALLNLSIKTVDSHRANAMRKLQLHSVADLVRYAIRNRMIEA